MLVPIISCSSSDKNQRYNTDFNAQRVSTSVRWAFIVRKQTRLYVSQTPSSEFMKWDTQTSTQAIIPLGSLMFKLECVQNHGVYIQGDKWARVATEERHVSTRRQQWSLTKQSEINNNLCQRCYNVNNSIIKRRWRCDIRKQLLRLRQSVRRRYFSGLSPASCCGGCPCIGFSMTDEDVSPRLEFIVLAKWIVFGGD